jgi:hypothetical protein
MTTGKLLMFYAAKQIVISSDRNSQYTFIDQVRNQILKEPAGQQQAQVLIVCLGRSCCSIIALRQDKEFSYVSTTQSTITLHVVCVKAFEMKI